MKKTLILTLLLFQLVALKAETTINFIEVDNLQQALGFAQKEDKLIFIDCSTDWCGHCKVMEKTVFTHPRVALFYNETFINLKIDPDQKKWSFIKEKYSINSYPTYLFIDKTGQLQHKLSGGFSPKDFLVEGKISHNSNANSRHYKSKIENGDHSLHNLLNIILMTLRKKN